MLKHVVLFTCFLVVASWAWAGRDYVGAEACIDCHKQEHQQWQLSDHYKAMAHATEETVLGAFDGKQLEFHGMQWLFSRENDRFFFEGIGPEGKQQRYEVLYTFGYFPLQQYLVDIGKGHLQALNIAWDSRPESQGGQRWFHLQPTENISVEHPFFWAGSFQNWNGRCADCHSTNLQKNYQSSDNSYNTTWSEINVSCEACHGPASEHVELAQQNKLAASLDKALSYSQTEKIAWAFDGKSKVAKPIKQASASTQDSELIDMCGGCHSRRMQIGDANMQGDYHDKYLLQPVDPNLYFRDGQILDEVYVLGSFMQSKMQHQGVQCTDCHNAHTGKLKAEPDAVCASCHLPDAYATVEHSAHKQGVQCVDCHMLERDYMVVDPRRDHRFHIPSPAVSERYQTPLACLTCHEDKDLAWASKVFNQQKWSQKEPAWVQAWNEALRLDPSGFQSLALEASQRGLPAQIQSALLRALVNYPLPEALVVIEEQLASPEPMVRRAALSSSTIAPMSMRWPLIQTLLQDPSRSVRFELASQLVDSYAELEPDAQKQVQPLLEEYRRSLDYSLDFPSTQQVLAALAMLDGDAKSARQAYLKALELEPAYVPALLGFAEFSRRQGGATAQAEELKLLKKAESVVPESAATQHALGLFYVRQQRYDLALTHLKAACNDSVDVSPRFFYVYAVALDSQGRTLEAVRVLQRSDKRWPGQFDTLSTLVFYLEKTRKTEVIPRYLPALEQIAPLSPQVRLWRKRYGS
ncbi:multiheme c-type cytochrome [Agaribacterium sp. ZY112]|uniref:multiheme c-type cytochrome n=1 Tax=Agaribacterium sp. ZY112 TaxID=3233574 RepID=UPI0035251BFA